MSIEFDYKGKPTQPQIEPPKRRPQFVSATVMLVWLESFEDHLHFPVGELILYIFNNICSTVKRNLKITSFIHTILYFNF